MTKFITGEELEKAIYDIIWEAEGTLLIVSPYIKLDDYFKKSNFTISITSPTGQEIIFKEIQATDHSLEETFSIADQAPGV